LKSHTSTMDEIILVSYLGGFVAALAFAVRERPPAPWATDFIIAATVAAWPLSALIALSARVYRLIPRKP
jgi:hypothetical protein